ncbi:hypothetical protein K474DRAFT_1260919 [Panus rudis PR-1116 ss-1]|nr:hypothetical protein K474DRAFT_1260919 [Panus rudis PR-1116 ss-1]
MCYRCTLMYQPVPGLVPRRDPNPTTAITVWRTLVERPPLSLSAREARLSTPYRCPNAEGGLSRCFLSLNTVFSMFTNVLKFLLHIHIRGVSYTPRQSRVSYEVETDRLNFRCSSAKAQGGRSTRVRQTVIAVVGFGSRSGHETTCTNSFKQLVPHALLCLKPGRSHLQKDIVKVRSILDYAHLAIIHIPRASLHRPTRLPPSPERSLCGPGEYGL